VDPDWVDLLVGVDIHPEFLEVAKSRFEDKLPCLQLFCSAMRYIELEPRSIDLIFCGLFFEHVAPKLVIAKMFRWLKPGGVFGTVLQLPDSTERTVSDTGVDSVKVLEPVSSLVEPDNLRDYAESAGFELEDAKTVTLQTGKRFYVVTYRLND
jgi:ubiquinone/menaquinone biosynthesis C-methylase UbiE